MILRAFNRKWYPKQARNQYLAAFSKAKWNALSETAKKKHQLSFCTECRDYSYLLQKSFPLNPKFSPPIAATVTLSADSHEQEEKTITKSIVLDLDKSFSDRFGHSFLDSVIDNCKETVEPRRTKSDIKRERRSLLRKCRDEVSKQMNENAALFTLAEDESLSRYQRKRLSQSFVKPSSPKRLKSHSPSDENVTWNEDQVLQDLTNFPQDTKINWSKFAREHGVSNRNGGQIIKEYAVRSSINVDSLEQKQSVNTRRVRSCKRKLPGINIQKQKEAYLLIIILPGIDQSSWKLNNGCGGNFFISNLV